MPWLCGPMNSRYVFTGSPCPHLDLALASNTQTLGEAIQAYEQHFAVRITPSTTTGGSAAEPATKYFDFHALDTGASQLVDIHVLRGGEAICPKQDLGFALLPDDVVEFGELIC